MERLNTVIIGMGKMGRIRCNAMKKHGGYDLKAVCDVNAGAISGYGVPGYADWKRCIDEIRPEAVVVCAFNSLVAEIVCYALGRGSHVFSEKPPGRSLSEALQMEKAFNAAPGRVLKFGFNHRYHNSVIEAKALIDSGLLGKLVCARGVYGKAGSENFPREWRNDLALAGGGILLDQGIHMVDLLCYFLGDFSRVDSAVGRLVWNDIPAEDSAFAILRSRDGRTASLHSSAIQWKHKFDLDLICTEGYIALNGLLTATESYGEERITYYRKDLEMKTGMLGNPPEHTMCFSRDESWDREMSEFHDAIKNHAPLANGSVADAVRVMSLLEQVYACADPRHTEENNAQGL